MEHTWNGAKNIQGTFEAYPYHESDFHAIYVCFLR